MQPLCCYVKSLKEAPPVQISPCPESAYVGSAILHEMLLHARAETVRVFPAMPSGWSDAAFYRLRSLNGLMVSAVRRGGKTAFVSLEAVVGGTFKIQVSDWELAAGDAPKTLPKSFPVEQRSDGTVLQLSPGSSVTLFLGSEQPDLRIDAVADGMRKRLSCLASLRASHSALVGS